MTPSSSVSRVAAGRLVLRSFALASSERRRTLDQIGAYGFHSAAVAEESADLRASFGDLAEATGKGARPVRPPALRRAGPARAARFGRHVRDVGRQVRRLAHPLRYRSGAAVPHVARGWPRLRLLLGGALLTVMGWYLPYVRYSVAPASGSSRSIGGPRARRPARDDGEGGVARLASSASPASRARWARSCGCAARAEPRPHTGGDAAQPSARRQPGDARVHPGARAGRIPRRLDRNDPARPGDRHAEAASPERGRARAEDADEDPLPLIALILPAMFIVTLGPVLMEALSFFAST